MADPGFPVGEGGPDLRHGHFSVKTHTKMKELDPVGGWGWGHAGGAPLDLPMAITIAYKGICQTHIRHTS